MTITYPDGKCGLMENVTTMLFCMKDKRSVWPVYEEGEERNTRKQKNTGWKEGEMES